jgi:hypothetical protein
MNIAPNNFTAEATFSLYSWWESCEQPARVFVIIRRHHTAAGEIKAIELLEKGKEWPVTREVAEIRGLVESGVLVKVSSVLAIIK